MTKIKRLLEMISSYSLKGNDMVLSDFYQDKRMTNSNPHEIIPISFNTYKILTDNYYNIEKYLVQTRSQAKSSGINTPRGSWHGIEFRP